jgi:PmbA protein
MDVFGELRSQAEKVEVVSLNSESTTVGFEANRLKMSQIDQTTGVAARVIKDGRLGFAASSDSSAVQQLVANALESAEFGDRIPLDFPGQRPAADVVAYDPVIAELSVARLVEMGEEIIDYLLNIEPEARIGVQLERGVQRIGLRNHAGADISFNRSPLSVSVEISRVQGDDVLLLWDVAGTTVWDDDFMASAHKLGRKLELAKKTSTLRSAKMPTLFSPMGSLALGYPLMLGLNGKNVFTGVSPMIGKVGETLFDSKISVADDATLDGRYASAPYDDEGVAHRRNTLVDSGVLKGFLYDLKTAAQSGVESTGNGARSLFSPPTPSPTNLSLQAGGTPVAEMIASIDDGLLVEDVLGLGQGNVISGAFSNSVGVAFRISQGEVVGRVKDVSIAGNIYELLKDVEAISSESAWVYSQFSLPYILLANMNVIAKE